MHGGTVCTVVCAYPCVWLLHIVETDNIVMPG